ncbi:Fic family protein [Xanthomonas campestris]|uniref:Fic family protein n=1 Tax=Xanthomonas campestris TaxID=339 RepID=UPI002B228FE0|nr:Fic family protein [Xanthomonas campestris]MEA9706371.1 Fic family protein [Xanthomonas campestris pv. raphani]
MRGVNFTSAMKARPMQRPSPGSYRTVSTAGEAFRAFVPAPLPPIPPVEWSPELRRRFDDALVAIGRLDAVSALLPNAALLLYSFIRKEAVLSSQIEGTQSSLADLLLYEIDEQPGVPLEDAQEVSRYVAALEHGLARLREGFPLSLRLMSEMHAVLLDHPSGRSKTPGEFRRSQVWIGGTRPGNAAFVPPPVDALADCLRDYERFLHDQPETTPPLLKAALAHVQFETIHPFLDGNGRIGRLLIVLQLVNDGLLKEPLLYPSLFFKKHRALYYELLNGVRLQGDWERWLDYFAEGIERSATQAVETARRLLALVNADLERIAAMGRGAASALAVHRSLQRQPITTAAALVKDTGLALATVNRALVQLVEAGIVVELTQRQRNRIFSYRAYAQALTTEL